MPRQNDLETDSFVNGDIEKCPYYSGVNMVCRYILFTRVFCEVNYYFDFDLNAFAVVTVLWQVKTSVILSYVRSIGLVSAIGIIVTFVASTAMNVSSSIWLASEYQLAIKPCLHGCSIFNWCRLAFSLFDVIFGFTNFGHARSLSLGELELELQNFSLLSDIGYLRTRQTCWISASAFSKIIITAYSPTCPVQETAKRPFRSSSL